MTVVENYIVFNCVSSAQSSAERPAASYFRITGIHGDKMNNNINLFLAAVYIQINNRTISKLIKYCINTHEYRIIYTHRVCLFFSLFLDDDDNNNYGTLNRRCLYYIIQVSLVLWECVLVIGIQNRFRKVKMWTIFDCASKRSKRGYASPVLFLVFLFFHRTTEIRPRHQIIVRYYRDSIWHVITSAILFVKIDDGCVYTIHYSR